MVTMNAWREPAVGVLVCAVLAGACGQSTPPPSTPPANVWATIDGRSITRDDVEKAYRISVQPNAAPLSDEEALTAKMSLLDDLISQDVLSARARASGVAATDGEVDAALAEQKRGMTDEAFQQQLSQRGISTDDVKAALRRELSIQKLLDRDVVAKATVTDDQVAAFYNQHKAQFNLTEPQYRIAQIVVTPERDPQLQNRTGNDAATMDEAKRKFDMLLERLRAGADFASLAMDYSEDPQSVARGGDIGYVSRSALNNAPAELRDTVLKTQPGGVSTVVGGGTFTILKLVAREPAGQRELTTPAVRDGIRDELQQQKAQLLRAAYVTAARDEAAIVNHLAHMVRDAGGVPGTLASAPVTPAVTPAPK